MAETSALDARRTFQGMPALELDLRPLGFACAHCQKTILSNMAWRCGYCDEANRRTKAYSFLHKCQVCERAPKSVLCPHCNKPVFLDKDRDASHPAVRFVEAPPPPPPPESPKAQKLREHADRKDELEREIEIETLNVKLKQVKASAEPPPASDAQTKTRKEIEAYLELVMGRHMAVEEFRKTVAEKYKDDPNSLEMANAALTRYIEEHM